MDRSRRFHSPYRTCYPYISAAERITGSLTISPPSPHRYPKYSLPTPRKGHLPFGWRDFLNFPQKNPGYFIDAQGEVTKIPVMNNEGVNGNYLSSEGVEGAGVWSTRAKWMKLYGVSGSDTVSIVFMDHPSNPNYPTFWHARDYGLFSANPFGQKDFTQGKEEFNFKLKTGGIGNL